MNKHYLVIIAILISLSACNNESKTTEKTVENKAETTTVQAGVAEYLVNATAWYQQSAEMQACYYQAFNLAKTQLLDNKNNSKSELPKAVVVDIDETMLDNSPFEAYLIKNNLTFTKELWSEWVKLEQAKALPGAVDFVNFAKENDVTVLYVSNRMVDNIQPTLRNLQSEGFEFAEEKNILLKSTTSDKTERRATLAKDYDIILLIGDNLRDFDEIFNDRNDGFGAKTVQENSSLFGSKYIVLPNPMYGQWEKAYKSSETETKTQNKISTLVAY